MLRWFRGWGAGVGARRAGFFGLGSGWRVLIVEFEFEEEKVLVLVGSGKCRGFEEVVMSEIAR